MRIYLDESGDLGWKFDLPFRAGGSSRYLTISFLILPTAHHKKPKKLIANLYKTYGWQSEKKASDASPHQKLVFCELAKKLLLRIPDIKIETITVNKTNVQEHIRQDSNKLYNYMTGLVILDHVKNEKNFELIPDERGIKVKSQNSLKDYLQIKLWFDMSCKTNVIYSPMASSNNYSLQFVDWIAHCIWSKYEDDESAYFNILKPIIKSRELFF